MAELNGIKIIHNNSFEDIRGELWTVYKKDFLNGLIFNHDKIAFSKKNVLRGLHTDKSYKLISCLFGKIQFVVVNYLRESEQYLQHQSFILDSSDKIKTSILIPPGYLNAHLVLSDEAIFYYKWSYEGEYPDTDNQISIRWCDPKLNINWLINDPILSERDKNSDFIID